MGINYPKAIVLLGTTGSGKSPLGDFCHKEGLWGRKCAHFDFGRHLRHISQNRVKPSLLTDADIDVITGALKTGVLLEDNHFNIARNIMMSFIEENGTGQSDLLLLNGLPRHIGQARDICTLIDVAMVVYLECTPEVVAERIRLNTGGDRTGRVDDSIKEIEAKIKLFEERTLPLLDYYRSNVTPIEHIDVAIDTTPQEIHRHLEVKRPF